MAIVVSRIIEKMREKSAAVLPQKCDEVRVVSLRVNNQKKGGEYHERVEPINVFVVCLRRGGARFIS